MLKQRGKAKTGEDNKMSKRNHKIMAAVCCTGLLVLGSVGLAQAQSPTILAGGGVRQDSMTGPI